ncbi:MAG: serine/threonine protein kinase [Patulibacter sp.]|nr:serine/threonine protein kinase [Patulibacter sp.]
MRTGTAVASPPPAAAPPTPRLRPGDVVLGRYELVRIAGRGGAGTVWCAEDRELGRPVAVKCLADEGSERALHEARTAARLNHPAIVSTYGLGHADGCAWLVTELVTGTTLRQTIVEDTHDDDELLEIGVAICAALRHAHQRGIVHRDVTPRNILIPTAAFPGTDRHRPCHPGIAPAKLADFGIARPSDQRVERKDGRIVGTLSYMAPERLEGAAGDEASDLWAAGVVLFEALTGEHPAGPPDKASALVRKHADLPSLRSRRGDLPDPVIRAIDRACAADPAARGTVEQLELALRDGLAARHVEVAPVLRDAAERRQPTADRPAIHVHVARRRQGTLLLAPLLVAIREAVGGIVPAALLAVALIVAAAVAVGRAGSDTP